MKSFQGFLPVCSTKISPVNLNQGNFEKNLPQSVWYHKQFEIGFKLINLKDFIRQFPWGFFHLKHQC